MCSGQIAIRATAVEQFGLAMIPLWRLSASGLISGMTSGTVGIDPEGGALVDDQAARLDGVRGKRAGDRAPRREKGDVQVGEDPGPGLLDRRTCGPQISRSLPADRAEAKSRSAEIGKPALEEQAQQFLTEAPVAPTIPTVKDALVHGFVRGNRSTKPVPRLGIKPTERVLFVRIGSSTLQFCRAEPACNVILGIDSRRPPSNVRDSLGTPRGLHEIAERIGDGQPAGMVFKSRVPTGRHFSEVGEDGGTRNLITSRILWLRGSRARRSIRAGDVDTYSRGTSTSTGPSGSPGSASRISSGCVLMRNLDIIELYEQVRAGDLGLIVD